MKNVMLDVGKLLALWVTLVLGQTIGGLLLLRGVAGFAADGPVNTGEALLIVAFIDALILFFLADHARLRGWRLGLTLGAALFGIQSAQSAIETVIFSNDVHMSAGMTATIAAIGFLRDALAGLVVALLWPGSDAAGGKLHGLAWKAPVIGLFYVACYFTAGNLIAWQSAAVRAYYAHISQIDAAWLVQMQIVRGLFWFGLAWLLVRSLSGSGWRTPLLVGLAFSGFMIPGLLYPNPVMPWAVRSVHMIEVGVSNFLFGLISALLLRWDPARHPLKPSIENR